MNYRQMEIFHAIMLTGSVTAAAKSLNLTQPAATKILRHTEDQLKFLLFHRIKGRLVPTDDAIAIFPDVERVFQEMRAVRQSLEDVRFGRRGTLSVVAIPTLGQVVLPRAIAAFTREHPDVPITFSVRPRRYVMQSVATQRAEVGFAFLTPSHDSVETKPMCGSHLNCIVPRNHPLSDKLFVTASDISSYPFISFSEDQGLQPLIKSAFAAGRTTLSSHLETGWISTAWALVDQGVGISLVDGFSQLGQIHTNVVEIPFRPETSVHVDVLTPRAKPLSRIAKQFVDVALQVLGEENS